MSGNSTNDAKVEKNDNNVATVEREFVQPSPITMGGKSILLRHAERTEGASRLHEHLGKKLDDASYLLGFAYSIIEGLTGGLPASDATLKQFRREYDAHFGLKRGAQLETSEA